MGCTARHEDSYRPQQLRCMPEPVEECSRLRRNYPPSMVDPKIIRELDKAEITMRSSKLGAWVGIPGWYAAERLTALRDEYGTVEGNDRDGWKVASIEVEPGGIR